jgi:hypothetical protein
MRYENLNLANYIDQLSIGDKKICLKLKDGQLDFPVEISHQY